MFKLLLSLAAVATIANAGWITATQSFFDKTIPTTPYSLELYGINARPYVFDVPNKPITCIIVYTESDLGEKTSKSIAPVMQCIPLK